MDYVISKDLIESVIAEKPSIQTFKFNIPLSLPQCIVTVVGRNKPHSRKTASSLNDFKANLCKSFREQHVFDPDFMDHFKTLFQPRYPSSGIYLAGGSVASLVSDEFDNINDYDFYITAEDEEAVKKEIEHMSEKILSFPHEESTVSRSKNALTFKMIKGFKETIIQVVLISAPTILEVIKEFDLQSSQVFYDGDRVYTTPLGQFAHDYSLNILNLERRRPNYEVRLAKYFERGYNIYLPHLKVGRNTYFKLPKIGIDVTSKTGYGMWSSKLYPDQSELFERGLYREDISNEQESSVSLLSAAVHQSLDEGIIKYWDGKRNFYDWLNDDSADFEVDGDMVKAVLKPPSGHDLDDYWIKMFGTKYAAELDNKNLGFIYEIDTLISIQEIFKDIKPIKFPFTISNMKNAAPYEVMTEKEWYGQYYTD